MPDRDPTERKVHIKRKTRKEERNCREKRQGQITVSEKGMDKE